MKTISLKVGSHRGAPRIWIEGAQLITAGFPVGSSFRVSFLSGSIVITSETTGDRKVSGRTREGVALPIIDLNTVKIATSLGAVSRISVAMAGGLITITAGEDAS